MDSFLEVKSSRNREKVNYNGIKLKNVDKNLFHLCLYVYLNFDNDVTNGKSKANDKNNFEMFRVSVQRVHLSNTNDTASDDDFFYDKNNIFFC